jgi:hypothetical protein
MKTPNCVQAGAFLLELDMTQSMRENFAKKLAWLEKRQGQPSIGNLRKDARIIPETPHSTLPFADGSTHGCFVIECHFRVSRFRPRFSHTLERRSQWEPVSAAWSDFDFAKPQFMPIASSEAKRLPSCQCNFRPSLSWSRT